MTDGYITGEKRELANGLFVYGIRSSAHNVFQLLCTKESDRFARQIHRFVLEREETIARISQLLLFPGFKSFDFKFDHVLVVRADHDLLTNESPAGNYAGFLLVPIYECEYGGFNSEPERDSLVKKLLNADTGRDPLPSGRFLYLDSGDSSSNVKATKLIESTDEIISAFGRLSKEQACLRIDNVFGNRAEFQDVGDVVNIKICEFENERTIQLDAQQAVSFMISFLTKRPKQMRQKIEQFDFLLERESGELIYEPSRFEMDLAVKEMSLDSSSFVILHRWDGMFIQSAILESGNYVVEYNEGKSAKQFRAPQNFHANVVVDLLASFRLRDNVWRTSVKWEPVDL